MKKITIVFLIFMSSFFGGEMKAQCGSGTTIQLNTQTGINNFITNNCTNFLGGLIILDNNDGIDNITDLSPLSTLTNVGGMLMIRNNFSLTSLNGLQALASVNGTNGMIILNNTDLTDISSLSSLTTIGGSLTIQTNNMASLTGLGNLTSVAGNLIIQNNDLLTDMTSLTNLTSIDGYLNITQNDLLTSLSGLESIDHTTIAAQNPLLDDIVITDNPLLDECEVASICDALDAGAVTANVMNNATGCAGNAAILTACQALPVEWLNQLTARVQETSIEISFATAVQINNSHFDIERSRDGNDFYVIGKIAGSGNTSLETYYNFLDKNPSIGSNYYRVKQVDFDGKFEYTNIASTQFKSHRVKIYPNPVSEELTVIVKEKQDVSIYNQLGRVVKQLSVDENANTIDLSELNVGIYYLRIGEEIEVLIRK